MKYLLAVLIAYCAGKAPKQLKEAPCYTECGMLNEYKGNRAISCNTLDEAESRVLEELNKVYCSVDSRFCKPYSCNQLFGWQIMPDEAEIMVTDVWLNDEAVRIPVSGLANCREKTVWLGAADRWELSSYAHEVVHIVQDCKGNGEETNEDKDSGSGHEGWTEGGLFIFIEQFKTGER
jgi:hypothetical protein